MNKNTKAFLIKLAMTFGVLLLVLGLFFGASLLDILIITLVLTIVGFVGDRVILPRIGGVSAAGADLILAFLVVWVLGLFLFDPDISVISAALLTSLFIAGGEFYYHKYLVHNLFENEIEHSVLTPSGGLITQTEFSEDFDKGLESYKEDERDNSKYT